MEVHLSCENAKKGGGGREEAEHRYLLEVVKPQSNRNSWLPWQPEEPVGPDALARLTASHHEPTLT